MKERYEMPRGGKRLGAGRPVGTGKFGEATKAIRLPINEIENVLTGITKKQSSTPEAIYDLSFYQTAISAGFPSPAEDEMGEKLNLNELLIKRPSATFFLRVSGSSMIKAGIHHNDILIVDRSIEPAHGKIVIAAVNGELTVKRLWIQAKKVLLAAENDAYQPIEITEDVELHIWGVVTNVIHSL